MTTMEHMRLTNSVDLSKYIPWPFKLIFVKQPSPRFTSFILNDHIVKFCLSLDNLKGSGPGCTKLSMSLVNVSLKFQTLISNIRQYFLLKKCEKLLQCKSFSHFSTKISVYLIIKSLNT